MTEVRLRDVEPAVLAVIRELARQNHRTMEQEIKAGLADIANAHKAQLLDRLAQERAEQRAHLGELSDSTPGIRAERDALVIVLDASVAAKLFVAEPHSEAAARVVAQHSLLHAPELICVEVASAITRKTRNRELDREAAERALNSWWEFLRLGNLRITPDRGLLPEAAHLSLALGHPLADCLYLALAARHRLPLVTADQPFRAVVRPDLVEVRLLTDLEGEGT